MKINKKILDKVELVEVEVSDHFKVTLCSFGASVYSIYYHDHLMNITPKELKEFYLSNKYFGKTLGPTAGRVANGEFQMDDVVYHLDKNEHGITSLHGGNHSLSFTNFVSEIKLGEKDAAVSFRCLRHDKDGGYPGEVNFEIQYLFETGKDEFTIRFLANTNDKSFVNLANHLYFNLGEEDAGELYLKLRSHYYMAMNDDLIPLEKKRVTKPFNFIFKKQIKKDVSNSALKGPNLNGYDNIFVIDSPSKIHPSMILESNKYKLKIYSDMKAAIIYSNNYLDDIELLNGYKDKLRAGITGEFMNLKPEIIDKFHPYDHYVKLIFSKKGL